MSDVHDKETRSYNMSRVRSRDTKPELLVRKYLFSRGFRYKLYDKKLPGKPDIVLPKYKTVIFVNGCFWHGHDGCRYFVLPGTRQHWWLEKIMKNKSNDEKNHALLTTAGWRVITIFECELKKVKREETFNRILSQLKQP